LSSKGLCEGPVKNYFVNSRAPHCWLLLLLGRLLGRLTIECMGRTTAVSVFSIREATLPIITHSGWINQRSNLTHLYSLWMDALKKGLKRGCGGGGLFLEPHGRPTQSVRTRNLTSALLTCACPPLPLPAL